MTEIEDFWKWSWREGVYGHPFKRWLTHTLWWTDEYKEFGDIRGPNGEKWGVPVRIQYFGTKYCWSIGAPMQLWDWKRNGWTDRWGRFSVYPRDNRERWERAGKPKTNRWIP